MRDSRTAAPPTGSPGAVRTFILHAGLSLCKTTELKKLGLARFQRKRKFIKPLVQNRLNSISVVSILEADYKVIDISDQKAKILNAAYRLLSRRISTAESAAVLSR